MCECVCALISSEKNCITWISSFPALRFIRFDIKINHFRWFGGFIFFYCARLLRTNNFYSISMCAYIQRITRIVMGFISMACCTTPWFKHTHTTILVCPATRCLLLYVSLAKGIEGFAHLFTNHRRQTQRKKLRISWGCLRWTLNVYVHYFHRILKISLLFCLCNSFRVLFSFFLCFFIPSFPFLDSEFVEVNRKTAWSRTISQLWRASSNCSAGFVLYFDIEHMEDKKGLTLKCRIFVTIIIISSYTHAVHMNSDFYYALRWKIKFLFPTYNYFWKFLVSSAAKRNFGNTCDNMFCRDFHQARLILKWDRGLSKRIMSATKKKEWPNKWRDSHNDKVLSFLFWFDYNNK